MKNQPSPKDLFESSIYGLASVSAVAVTFLAVPLVYDNSIDWIRDFSAQHYGEFVADLASIGWFGTCSLFIFFLARASLSTCLTVGGLAIAARFL